MLKIFVEGQEIFIKTGTSIQMEVNNSVFFTSYTEGEVVFTFSVPAEMNDLIFKHAKYVYVQRVKKYKCKIEISGYEIANGDLYIQQSDKNSYSVGVVCNPFPDGFQSRMLNDTKIRDKVVISERSTEHNAKWIEFLKETLDPDSVIKFPLFLDPSFYGESNPNFGFFQLNPFSVEPNAALTDLKSDPDHCFVNRLFFDDAGEVVEEIEDHKGIRIFNKQGIRNMNSFTFCPAFQLLYVLERLLNKAGYQLIGNIKSDPFFRKNYLQSLRALDGNKLQYDVYQSFKEVVFNSPVTFSNLLFAHTVIDNLDFSMGFYVGDTYYKTFRNAKYRNVTGSVKIKTYIPESAMYYDDIEKIYYRLGFFIVNESEGLPTYCNPIGDLGYFAGASVFPSNKGGFIKIFGNGVVGEAFGWNGPDYYEFEIPFTTSIVNSQNIIERNYKFVLAKIGLQAVDPTDLNPDYYEIVSWEKFFPNTDWDLTFYNYNIFAKEFNISDCLPKITNLDFINEICNVFGIARYIDSSKKEIEFSFVKDILKSSKVLDVSQYCIQDFPRIGEEIDRQYVICFNGESEAIVHENMIDPVESFVDMPPPKMNVGKYCYVRENNSIYKAVAVKNENAVIVSYEWKFFSVNVLKNVIGANGSSPLNFNFKIGSQKKGIKTMKEPCFPVIDCVGYSPVLNAENNSTDVPSYLLTYYGNERFYYSKYGDYVNREVFRVIAPDEFEGGMDLTVNTENSIGNNLVKPWLKFIGNYETVTYQFVFPVAVFMQVLRTLKPQDKPTSEQERFMMVDNVKLLPIKMNFNFKAGKELVIAEIDFAKEKIVP